GDTYAPSLSGPRWISRSRMATSSPPTSGAPLPNLSSPQMPHMAPSPRSPVPPFPRSPITHFPILRSRSDPVFPPVIHKGRIFLEDPANLVQARAAPGRVEMALRHRLGKH